MSAKNKINTPEIVWLEQNKGVFKVSAIERQLKMPHSTLEKYFKGERSIQQKWIPSIVSWVKKHRGCFEDKISNSEIKRPLAEKKSTVEHEKKPGQGKSFKSGSPYMDLRRKLKSGGK